MNLAFCLFNYFSFGGLQRDFYRIVEACLQRGHTVTVYTMRWEGKFDTRFPIHVLPLKGWQNHTRCQQFVKQLQLLLSAQSFDLIIGFNKMPGLDVYYAADTCYQAAAKRKHGLLYRLLPRYRHLVAYEKAVFDPNQQTQVLLIAPKQQQEFQYYYQTPANRFHLLPPGIAKDRIAPPDAACIRQTVRQEQGILETDFLLLMVGSGFKTKGLDRILTGIAALPNRLRKRVQLFVIGQDRPDAFKRQALKLQIDARVTFLGGRYDVPRFLLAADLLLHPAYNENTGTVLLEALCSGLPVLTTDVCGYAHYVQKANAGAVLTSPFCQNTFNQTLATMLLSTDQEKWRQQALLFAKSADIYSLPERAVDIIEKLGALT